MGPPFTITPVTQSAATTVVTQTAQTAATTVVTTPTVKSDASSTGNILDDFAAKVLETNARNNAIAAAKETASASHLNAENAAKLAKTYAANAEQALKDAKAASVAACAASKKTTENLKLLSSSNL